MNAGFPLLLVVLALAPRTANAQEVVPISREAVLAELATQNVDVARAMMAVERARIDRRATFGVLDPVLTAQLDFSHARTPTESGLSAGISTDDRTSVTAGVVRTFAPGTRLGFNLTQAVNRSEFPLRTGLGLGDQRIVTGPDVQTTINLELTQPILRGFGRSVVLGATLSADRTIDVRERELIQLASGRQLEAITGYAELRYAGEEVTLRVRSLERTESQLAIAEAELEAGQIAPIEVDLVREQIALRTEARLLAEAEAERRARELERVIGTSPRHLRGLVAADMLFVPPAVQFRPDLCDEAEEASADVAVLRAQVELARTRLRFTADDRRANLDATAGMTQSGLDSAWAGSIGQALSFEAPTIYGALVFSTPLRNRAARATHDGSLADVDAAEAEVDVLADGLCFSIHDAVESLVLLAERDGVAEYRVTIAGRAVEAEQARFQQGLSTVQAGLDALENLEAAEISLLRVRTDAEIAWWQLEHLRGRLVDDVAALSDSI